jgi:hypothetical protein
MPDGTGDAFTLLTTGSRAQRSFATAFRILMINPLERTRSLIRAT